jgi:hypothetical protein
LAASAFSMAALPAAVENGMVSSNAAYQIAANAAREVRRMIGKSATATRPAEIERYGYGGMLCHYPVWNEAEGEFQAQHGVEFSSIDTTLLLYGLLVSAEYFGGSVRTDYESARNGVHWHEWLDQTTPGHRNQFHMAYRPGHGFFAWWDWYSQETILLAIFAAMSDPDMDLPAVWRAWRRAPRSYTSPEPGAKTFSCFATWFGDPFTVVYGLAFLDFARFPVDLDGQNWFQEGQTAYFANVEYCRRERGYLDGLCAGFSICSPNGIQGKPSGAIGEPVTRNDATIYTVAGGLQYYACDPAANPIASALSGLLNDTPGFLPWHGWPAATVNATTAAHPVLCDRIIGQDISFVGLAVDNYFNRRAPNLVLRDAAMRGALVRVFPPRVTSKEKAPEGDLVLHGRGIPYSVAKLERAEMSGGEWLAVDQVKFDSEGVCLVKPPRAEGQREYRLSADQER